MINIILNVIKIIFILGTLVFIHELGHFTVARLFKVKVNEFAIGFGPTIWKKQGAQTKYALRLIPLGGFVSMEGEETPSDEQGSFSKISIPKKIAVIAAGGVINIIFALILYFGLVWHYNTLLDAFLSIKDFFVSIFESLKMIFTGGVNADQLMGPVGISNVISKTSGISEFIYIFSIISLSLGVTNLLPFPPLDGGKIVLLIISGIIRKPIDEKLENTLQLIGFGLLITLSIYVTINDVIRIF